MNAQPTPGPWSVVPARSLGTPHYEPAKIVAHPEFVHIATVEFPAHNVHGDAIETDVPSSAQEANARLIAAAPELLQSLKQLLNVCVSVGLDVEQFYAETTAARFAILAAEVAS